MSDIKINNITDRSGSSGPIFAGISTVSTSAFMVMPSGPTEFRGGRGRGVFGGGTSNVIDYITIASEGNAIDFGDTGQTHTELMGSSCNSVRMLIAGGNSPGQQPMSDIDFITIATTGNGQDFGNLSQARRGPASLSDSHGGLGGF